MRYDGVSLVVICVKSSATYPPFPNRVWQLAQLCLCQTSFPATACSGMGDGSLADIRVTATNNPKDKMLSNKKVRSFNRLLPILTQINLMIVFT